MYVCVYYVCLNIFTFLLNCLENENKVFIQSRMELFMKAPLPCYFPGCKRQKKLFKRTGILWW